MQIWLKNHAVLQFEGQQIDNSMLLETFLNATAAEEPRGTQEVPFNRGSITISKTWHSFQTKTREHLEESIPGIPLIPIEVYPGVPLHVESSHQGLRLVP